MISTATSNVGGAMRSITVFCPRRRFASSSLSVTLHQNNAAQTSPYLGSMQHCCAAECSIFCSSMDEQKKTVYPALARA